MPTASGFGRHRTVHPPEASQALGWVLDAIAGAGAEPWVHSCAADTPLDLLRGAGAAGLSVDHAQLSARDHDELAAALEAGRDGRAGRRTVDRPGDAPTDGEVTEAVLRWLEMLGLDPEQVGDRLVLTPACGLAGRLAGVGAHRARPGPAGGDPGRRLRRIRTARSARSRWSARRRW